MGRSDIIAELSRRIREVERSRRPERGAETIAPASAGWLASQLAGIRGGLVEWLSEGAGSGRTSLALLTARPVVADGLWIVVDPRREWYAPGLMAAGLELDRVLLVRPAPGNDALWAVEQALQTRGVGAVVCEIDRLSSAAFRRLQLAAEAGGGVGILLRPERARQQPSWAERRFLVRPLPTRGDPHPPTFRRRVQVELLHARRHFARDTVVVEIDDGPDDRLRVASELGRATSHGEKHPGCSLGHPG